MNLRLFGEKVIILKIDVAMGVGPQEHVDIIDKMLKIAPNKALE